MMNISRTAAHAAGMAMLLAACSVSAPVTGTMSTGEALSGIATANASGAGVVEVHGGGIACNGSYNALSAAPLLSVPLACSGGVTGMAQVERSPDLMSGKGTFTLSDGRGGEFSYVVE